MQAFLPIGDSTLLTEIRSCSGPATVFDSRVICVRHSDSSNITARTSVDGTLLLTGDYVPTDYRSTELVLHIQLQLFQQYDGGELILFHIL